MDGVSDTKTLYPARAPNGRSSPSARTVGAVHDTTIPSTTPLAVTPVGAPGATDRDGSRAATGLLHADRLDLTP